MIWSNRNHWFIETMNEPTTIREILDNAKTIAVVGLTNKEGRASLGVSRFMQSRGYRIIPVNPQIDNALGEKIRARRILAKMSQAELGDHVGVSFQQVQKYERGVNRVGASRLFDRGFAPKTAREGLRWLGRAALARCAAR